MIKVTKAIGVKNIPTKTLEVINNLDGKLLTKEEVLDKLSIDGQVNINEKYNCFVLKYKKDGFNYLFRLMDYTDDGY